MNTAVTATAAGARRRPSFVIPVAGLAFVLTVAGFWKTYFGPLLHGVLDIPWIFHVHTVLFLGWMVLVALQAWWASRGRLDLHVAVGRYGMIYGAFIAAFGIVFSVYLFAQQVEAGHFDRVQRTLAAPFTDIGVFVVGLCGAWLARRRPAVHFRFIVVATNGIIIAGVTRLPIIGGTRSLAARDIAVFMVVCLLPMWLAMIRDYAKERRIHPVYLFGVALLVGLRFREALRQTDIWLQFTTWLAGHFGAVN